MDAIVAESMKVLDQPLPEPDTPNMIERDGVRSKLRIDRTTGIVPLSSIRPDPDQPRKVDTNGESFRELVASVKTHGVLEPITVRHIEDGDYFQIIAGERRYHAARAAGLTEVRAIVHDVDDTTKAIHQLVENLQREDLNPIEEAAAMRHYLTATGETHEQLAARLGKSRIYVSHILAIDEGLTHREKIALAGTVAGNRPGKSSIYEALRAPAPVRAAILSGNLTRLQAREQIARARKPALIQSRTLVRTIHVEELKATVTVRFPKKPPHGDQAIIDALDAARAEAKREMQKKQG